MASGGRRIGKLWRIIITVAFVSLAVLAACGGDDDDDSAEDPGRTASPEEIAELEDLATELLQTDPTDEGDVDAFLDHITDEGLGYFGYESSDECAENAEDCIGSPIEVESLVDTDISNGEARTTAVSSEGDVVSLLFVRDGGDWKLNGFATSAEIPEGYTVIEVSGIDYGYDWSPDEAVAGNVAFSFTNNGEEAHEMAVVAVADNFSIESVKLYAEVGDFQTRNPPGVQAFVGFAFATPGLTSNTVPERPLAPGNYAFLCFLPSEDGTPHVLLDMYSEFTVE